MTATRSLFLLSTGTLCQSPPMLLRTATMATLTRPAVVRVAPPRPPPILPTAHAFPQHASSGPPTCPRPPRNGVSTPPMRPPTKRFYTRLAKHDTPQATKGEHSHRPLTGEPPAGVSGSHMNANIPEALDEALQSKGQKWVEAAASDSEAIVKAERMTEGSPVASIEQMQQVTVKELQQE